MGDMNLLQKTVVAAGVILAALRAAFPVRYAGLGDVRLGEGSGFPDFMVKTDWQATGLHIALITAVTVVLAFLCKKK